MSRLLYFSPVRLISIKTKTRSEEKDLEDWMRSSTLPCILLLFDSWLAWWACRVKTGQPDGKERLDEIEQRCMIMAFLSSLGA